MTQTYPLLTRARHISQSAVLGSQRRSSMKDRSCSERPEDWDFYSNHGSAWLTSCLRCVLSLEIVTSSSLFMLIGLIKDHSVVSCNKWLFWFYRNENARLCQHSSGTNDQRNIALNTLIKAIVKHLGNTPARFVVKS